VLQPKAFAGTYGHVRNELIFNENKSVFQSLKYFEVILTLISIQIRALLKRISIILTTKGEDVEKDYLELKKHYIPKCKSNSLFVLCC